MQEPPNSLMSLLKRREPDQGSLLRTVHEACADLGLGEEEAASPICLGYALLKHGALPEEVSRLLSWREFERLSAALFRASGYSVRENVVLTKPRAQIDIVAVGDSLVLSVDCKHYRRGHAPSSLSKFAKDQVRRGALLRKRLTGVPPIASVILSMSEPEGKFIEGAAVVPIRTLRSFLTTLDTYVGLLALQ